MDLEPAEFSLECSIEYKVKLDQADTKEHAHLGFSIICSTFKI